MKKEELVVIIATLILMLGACTTEDASDAPTEDMPDTEQTSEEDATDEEEEAETEERTDFEEQIQDTISLEGMEEPIVLNLYDNPEALFLTYVPKDLMVEEISGGEGEAYNFYANFSDEKREDIYLQIYIFSEAVTEQPSAENKDSTYALAVEEMDLVEENTTYDWAIEEYMSPEGSRSVALGEHNGRYFMVVLNSTVEYSEGFVPRANKVLEHFYWKDSEEFLENE